MQLVVVRAACAQVASEVPCSITEPSLLAQLAHMVRDDEASGAREQELGAEACVLLMECGEAQAGDVDQGAGGVGPQPAMAFALELDEGPWSDRVASGGGSQAFLVTQAEVVEDDMSAWWQQQEGLRK